MERSAQTSEIWESSDPPLAYAQNLLSWYARNQRNSRLGHYAIEVAQLVTAAATTVAAATDAGAALTAGSASLTLLLTGLRQVCDFQEKWATLTSARVRIEHEINLYRVLPVESREAAGRTLIFSVDSILAEETQSWADRLRASRTRSHDTPPSPE